METENNNVNQPQQNNAPTIDYEKLAGILDSKQKATEDSFLKGFYKQQGLSEDEMKQAIASFKEEKAKRTPNIDALNQQIADANTRATNAEIRLSAMTMAGELGVPANKMPYLLKMADLSNVVVNGNISEDKLKENLSKVLKDVPELKTTVENATGFKVGADGGQKPNTSNEELARIFGVKMK